MGELEEFRADKDAFFSDHPRSPLTPPQRASFAGLDYFPENPALVLEVLLETEGVDREEPIAMQTTTGGDQVYRRAGVIRFEVEGAPARLTLFAAPGMRELFLPFRDATSGAASYGGGRYLEVEPPAADGKVIVDLNHAYNPYCAYSPEWSCPIPPGENWLTVPVEAGERIFRG